MTITTEALDAKFVSAYQADKPCFIVRNLLTGTGYNPSTNAWYRAATAGSGLSWANKPTLASAGSATLANLADLPIAYTHDLRASLYSSPDDGSANNDYYWGLYASRWQTLSGASYSEYAQSFYVDALVIKSHAWGEGTAATYPLNEIDINVDMSTETDFPAAPGAGEATVAGLFGGTTYMDDPTSNPHPLGSGVSHTLTNVVPSTGNYRYLVDGDAYFRVQYNSKGSATEYWTTSLQVGEVFIGERIQMSRNPNQPYLTELSYADNSTTFESSRGDIVRYVRSKGQRRWELNFTPTGDDSYGIDDVAQIRTLLKKTNQFTQPFMFVPKPYTEPNNAYFVYAEDAAFNMESVGPFERSVTLSLVEIPPYVDYEVR